MTFAEFSDIFGTLALQLRAIDADETMAKAYYATMKPLEAATVRLAAERFAGTGTSERNWFPDTAQWIGMVNLIRHERREAQRDVMRRLTTPLCLRCDDTGFERLETGRVRRCVCQDQREREIAGLRPLPMLRDGSHA